MCGDIPWIWWYRNIYDYILGLDSSTTRRYFFNIKTCSLFFKKYLILGRQSWCWWYCDDRYHTQLGSCNLVALFCI